MARWQVAHWHSDDGSENRAGQPRCLRVFPEGEPERWVVQTNPALPREVQEEIALQIAAALFALLGV